MDQPETLEQFKARLYTPLLKQFNDQQRELTELKAKYEELSLELRYLKAAGQNLAVEARQTVNEIRDIPALRDRRTRLANYAQIMQKKVRNEA